MADYNIAYQKLDRFEGGYVEHKDDRGGETIFGIAREFHPGWEGWIIVDKARKLNNFPENVENNEHLNELAKQFYKELYWDIFQGDLLEQDLAEEILDVGVNIGAGTAIEWLQRILNILDNAPHSKDIAVDGIWGGETSMKLRVHLSVHSNKNILKLLNVRQGDHYMTLAEKSPSQEVFIRGWLKRVVLIRS